MSTGPEQSYFEMISVLGHELRRPLTIIRGAATLLVDSDDVPPASARQMLGMIDTHAQDMSDLIEDLLLMCHLEAGDTGLFMEPLQVAELVEATVEAAQRRLGTVELDIRVPPGLEVEADLDRSTRALRALLENAARHSPPAGTVTVTAEAEADKIRVRVGDAGPGIPATEREAMFDRFRQGEGQASGLGLGLYLARGLARIQGGDAGLDGGPDGGASAWITLRRRG